MAIETGLCAPVTALRSVLLLGQNKRSRIKAWWGNLGLNDVNSSQVTWPAEHRDSVVSQVGCIVCVWALSCDSHPRRACGTLKGKSRSSGEQLKSSVRRKNDGGVCGPQRPWGRPEQRRAQEGGLDEGGGAHWVAQSQWVGGHCAQGWLGEGAGQEASRQSLGQMLMQSQFGLKKTGRASVRGQRPQGGQRGQRGQDRFT